jgi:hypothetical protein
MLDVMKAAGAVIEWIPRFTMRMRKMTLVRDGSCDKAESMAGRPSSHHAPGPTVMLRRTATVASGDVEASGRMEDMWVRRAARREGKTQEMERRLGKGEVMGWAKNEGDPSNSG